MYIPIFLIHNSYLIDSNFVQLPYNFGDSRFQKDENVGDQQKISRLWNISGQVQCEPLKEKFVYW